MRCDYVLHTHYQGLMLFWDLRACKFLESTMNSNRAVTLKVCRISTPLKMFKFQSPMQASRGWVQRDDTFMDAFQNQKYVIHYEKGVINIKGLCWISFLFRYFPAIYTHCYDTSGTRLFAAGGPLQCGLKVWAGCHFSLELPFRLTWYVLNIWADAIYHDCWKAHLESLFA